MYPPSDQDPHSQYPQGALGYPAQPSPGGVTWPVAPKPKRAWLPAAVAAALVIGGGSFAAHHYLGGVKAEKCSVAEGFNYVDIPKKNEDEPTISIPAAGGWTLYPLDAIPTPKSPQIRGYVNNLNLEEKGFVPGVAVTLQRVPDVDISDDELLNREITNLKKVALVGERRPISICGYPAVQAEAVDKKQEYSGTALISVITNEAGDRWTLSIVTQTRNPKNPSFIEERDAVSRGVTIRFSEGSNAAAASAPAVAPPALEQPPLKEGFTVDGNPIQTLNSGLYNVLRQPAGDSVAITGYVRRRADGSSVQVDNFAFDPRNGTWRPLTIPQLAWSPIENGWVETLRGEEITAGPAGSRGWPTVKGVSDFGTTSYYTITATELGGELISEGLESGFAQGGSLPASLSTNRFSAGAKAYVATETSVDAFYTIHRVKSAETNGYQFQTAYSCEPRQVDSCTTPARDLSSAAGGGQFMNFAGTVRLDLAEDGTATLRDVRGGAPLATYTHTTITGGGPDRITLSAANDRDAKTFGDAMGINLTSFALFEYDSKVVAGVAQPANTTHTVFAGYNRAGIGDILKSWTPALPPIQN